jgi:ATP-dependent DNA ligase
MVNGYEYIGKVEIGVSPHARKKIIGAKTLKKSIFSPEPKVNRKTAFSNPIRNSKVVWLKPIRCRVKFLELDQSGIMRHPSFKGIVSR